MKKAEPLMPSFLFTPREAAQALAISESHLWKLKKKGEIPAVRINRCLRYDPDVLRDFVKKRGQTDSGRAKSQLASNDPLDNSQTASDLWPASLN